jgi:recombination protein RecA
MVGKVRKVMPEIQTIEEMKKAGIIKMGDDPAWLHHFVPTGIPSLDTILGGGFARGKCAMNYGEESAGKTIIAQKAIAAVQATDTPDALYIDAERSFDEEWWKQSGVDTQKLMVSAPFTAEESIDVMRGVLNSCPTLGIIVVDSLAAMTPAPEMDEDRSSTQLSQPGAQAKVITKMYRQILPMLDNRVIFLATNQMRENIGGHNDLAALPGGRAARHFSHVVLKTRRSEWITDNTTKGRLGFYMEISSRKNKLAVTPDGEAITIPFMFSSQIDWTTTYIEDAIKAKVITRKGPWYYWANVSYMGMQPLRQFFHDNPDEMTELRQATLIHE